MFKQERQRSPERKNPYSRQEISTAVPSLAIETTSTDRKAQQKAKGATGRGIYVISRNSNSRQRKGLATSRSHQRNKVSKEIKSTTNISEFESYHQSSDEKGSRDYQNNYENLSQKELLKYFKRLLKEKEDHLQTAKEMEVRELRDIISSNQKRIDNLVKSIESLLWKNQKRQKAIEELECRVDSIYRYQQKSENYTNQRWKELQQLFDLMKREVLQLDSTREECSRKIKNVEVIVKEVFTIQRLKNKQSIQVAVQGTQALRKIQLQMDCLSSVHRNNSCLISQSSLLHEHLQHLEQELEQTKNSTISNKKCQQGLSKISSLKSTMRCLQEKVNILEEKSSQLCSCVSQKEQQARKSIYQLSSLLNQQERHLEKEREKSQQSSLLAKQLTKQLSESQLQCFELQQEILSISSQQIQNNSQIILSQKQEENIQKQNQISFLKLKIQREQIESLQKSKQNQRLEKQIQLLNLELTQTKRELNINITKIAEDQREILERKEELRILREQKLILIKQIEEYKAKEISLKDECQQNCRQILKLQTQIQTLKVGFEQEFRKVGAKYLELQKEFRQEQLYSEHLESENQQLESNLEYCKKVFQEQSQMFRNTIQQLKEEKKQIESKLERNI